MTVEAAIFRCSICGEPSAEICVACTKDTCGNHLCERCKRCSDCCECDVPLSAEEAHAEPVEAAEPEAAEPEAAEPAAEAAEPAAEESVDAAPPSESLPVPETDGIPPEEAF
jgi:hypothetical protein